ncbi:MAG: MFS transporter [Moraxellaceae bacterium]|nr:MFS transporter [Moraxellaceae bacterium]
MTATPLSSRAESRLVWLLAGIQFCHIVDFMVMMPLGPQLMRTLHMSTAEFGLLVSAYTLSAGLTGFAGAFVIDRVDRRRLMLALFTGFIMATLACGFAWSFGSLLLARVLAGMFGGVLAATLLAIIGDCIPAERRGAATGKVMAGFALAAVAGVPLGIWMATHGGWRLPFYGVAATGVLLWLLALRVLPSIPARDTGPLQIAHTLRLVMGERNHLRAFALVSVLMLAGFSVIAFISPYMVHNVGLTEAQLALIYLYGGIASLLTAPLIGKLTDRIGKTPTFRWFALLSLLPLLALTHLPPSPLPLVLMVTTAFMVFIGGRMIAAITLIQSASTPELRGRFLSFNSAIQQLASGLAAFLPTLLLTEDAAGRLLHYDLVGYGAAAMTVLAIWLAGKIEIRS